ncbi:MAG: hypothetical protein ED555_11270 [Allomuricauda sp.]|nr:MAG: hypothetical protein ED555_11270 [Allomuricauda sp.]
MLHNFSEKLGSYTCEPTDYQCFTQVSDLKYNIRELLEDQQGVLAAIRNKANDLNLVKAINELFERFGRIEQQIAAYLIATNPYQ